MQDSGTDPILDIGEESKVDAFPLLAALNHREQGHAWNGPCLFLRENSILFFLVRLFLFLFQGVS